MSVNRMVRFDREWRYLVIGVVVLASYPICMARTLNHHQPRKMSVNHQLPRRMKAAQIREVCVLRPCQFQSILTMK